MFVGQSDYDCGPLQLQLLLRERERQIEALRQDRDRQLQERDRTIEDLRHRLDVEGEERRKLTMVLLAQQTHADGMQPPMQPQAQRNAPPDATPGVPATRRRWWPWRKA
jgi:hypothetical protein